MSDAIPRSLTADESTLGQYIPPIYHYNMLNDQARMGAFEQAIAVAVRPGDQVLELGGGTAVLSWFAARQGGRVLCVERNPALVAQARRFLALNDHGEQVSVVQADALEYLPPHPVQVVVCEMLHVGMLREKQIAVIEGFKQRYLARFGGPLPRFVPEAFFNAVQPVMQDYGFHGYQAPVALFQDPLTQQPRTTQLGAPVVYQHSAYEQPLATDCGWQGELAFNQAGELNALRFITKNVVAVDVPGQRTVDWYNQYLVVPLAQTVPVQPGDRARVRFAYQAGDAVEVLQPEIELL